MHMQCVFLYVMYELCLTRRYAAFTSTFRQRILCACCPQRVGHFVFSVRVGNNLSQIQGPMVRSQLASLEFFIDIKSFRSHCGPGVDSASNINENQEYFLGVKAAGA